MSPRSRDLQPEEELDFDDRGDTHETEEFKPKPKFHKKGIRGDGESDGTQDGILETDQFISGLTGDAIASREKLKKL